MPELPEVETTKKMELALILKGLSLKKLLFANRNYAGW